MIPYIVVGIALAFGLSKLAARRAARLQYLRDVAYAVNPADSTSNCGYIIDAVIARTCGRDPHAVAPAVQDGSFADIEARHNTTIVWGLSFNEAFDRIRASREGATAVLGIRYAPHLFSSHVVVIVKRDGVVAIVEAQHWGSDAPREVITTPQRANERYNQDGRTAVGLGLIDSFAVPAAPGTIPFQIPPTLQ